MKVTEDAIHRRLTALEARTKPVAFDLSKVLFKEQLPFGLDLARYQTAVTPRRAGKSYGISGKLLKTSIDKPGGICLYITRSRTNAKRILWEQLKEINRTFQLGGEEKEAELYLKMPNGSRIYLSGATNEAEVEKFRGLPLSIAIIDEAQSFPSYIEKLIDSVIAPALTDYAGAMCLVGTPGPVPSGYFYEKTQSPEWSHHGWSVFDNIHLERKSGKPTKELLGDELKRRGVTQDDPIIQREWFGRWVLDVNSLVFKFDPAKNIRTSPAALTDFVIGVDFGWHDADALAVLGWSSASKELDVVYEWVGAKQSITALTERIQKLYETYQPIAVVADTGGLGKKIAEEIQERTGLPIEAADKNRKHEHIEFVNDDLRAGRMFVTPESKFAADAMLVEWDRSNPSRPKIGERFHSDITDAVLYAHRRCQQWLFEQPKDAPPPINSIAWQAAQEAKQVAEMDAMFEKKFAANRERIQEAKEIDSWL